MATDEWVVHGCDCSYYTGKLEAYLRAKGIAYRLAPFSPSSMKRAARSTGVMQIPQIELPDGGWLVDTSRIIDYVEELRPQPSMRPASPALRFVSLLLEDYADEWLWRPAMHYRWSYGESALLVSRWLAEHAREVPGPFFLKRLYWYTRQRWYYVRADGVTARTRAAVEASYLGTLASLDNIFRSRDFVLGARPSEADFGFFASMFRHFFCDPTPGRIMRERAPGVHAWVARLWNLRPESFADAPPLTRIPDDVAPLLHDVTHIYLPYLAANAVAHAAGKKHATYHVQGVDWREPVKPYRVWCLGELQRRYAQLGEEDRAVIDDRLGAGAQVLQQPLAVPVADLFTALPLRGQATRPPADSWWR